jgi:internalin A
LELGKDIKWESRGEGIFLEGNPLEIPPVEIVEQGNEAIRNYFNELKKEKTVRFLESKLLIVGNGEVGKTSLMKKYPLLGFRGSGYLPRHSPVFPHQTFFIPFCMGSAKRRRIPLL